MPSKIISNDSKLNGLLIRLKKSLSFTGLLVGQFISDFYWRAGRRVRYLIFAGKRFIIRYRIVHYIKLAILVLVLDFILFLVPSPFSFFKEELPFYGDFSWNTPISIRLSPGESGEARGGLENYIPKLRLIEYRVKRGDTLWSIARKFDIDPDSIISCNTFSNVHMIHEGDVIYIPNMRGIFINVQEGDTIFKYTSKYKVPTDLIMEVNELETNELTPGMKIFLPGVRYNNIERAYVLGEAFDKPVRGWITSRFGYRRDPFSGKHSFHTGIDIACRYGSPVYAAQDGVVLYAGYRIGYGRVIILQHRFGYKTVYAHLSGIRVSGGQRVRRAQIIGFSGNSGRSTGPHLHFEVWHKSRVIDPLTQTNMAVR